MTSDVDAEKMILRADRVAVSRGRETLFSDFSFSVQAGKLYWLKGRNGQGKTSLLRAAAGLTVPAAGWFAWGSLKGRAAPGYCAYLAHENSLKGELTALESLAFLARLAGKNPEPRELTDALDRFHLGGRRNAWIKTLSQGQRRSVALARLALEDASVLWILDEPFDALDDRACRTVGDILASHLQRNGAALLATHVALPHIGSGVESLELPARRNQR
ncbi:MAG: hypothetical protein RLZZ126_1607 [Pseudomonadota bacterium]|jgi:heme exporter protein A